MKIFRIKNRRNSLATNSSSTHSVVYKNKEQVFEDLGIFDNRYYDRCTETIAASREAKIRYIFSNIFYCEPLVELMALRYPEMKEYFPMVKEHFELYCNVEKQEEIAKETGRKYWEVSKDFDEFQFGDHCRGSLYNTSDLHLSYEFLCNIIDSPDIVIVGGSDEHDFVYDTTKGCKEIDNKYSYMEKINHKVKNGNYYILYGEMFGDKEKIRLQVDSIPDMIPKYPELVDIKITDACEHRCPFCYMDSTPEGKHATYSDICEILYKFNIRTEFALGGGNVLLNPDFYKIVRAIQHKGHIANITIRYDDVETLNNNETLMKAVEKYVSGIGLSVQKAEDVESVKDFIIKMLSLGKHISLHIIPELIGSENSFAILEKLDEVNEEYLKLRENEKSLHYNYCKVLYLGLKQSGRAKNMKHNLLSEDELNTLSMKSHYRFNVDTAFINTYDEWIKKKWGGDEEYFLTRHEGEFSMFIDAVKLQCFTSSYKDDGGIDIDSDIKLEDLFGAIREKNGFKKFEKPEPYYNK